MGFAVYVVATLAGISLLIGVALILRPPHMSMQDVLGLATIVVSSILVAAAIASGEWMLAVLVCIVAVNGTARWWHSRARP